MIGTFMFVLDFFIVKVALPSIQQGLGAGESAIEWIVAGYAISTAPNILSILGVVYTGPARVRAISVYGMVMGLAAVSGQLIGGILIRADLAGLGWRAIFWINVPLGLAALLACPRLVPESRAGQGSRFDLAGVALITAGLVAVVLPLVDGRQEGWPAWSWIALGSSVPLAIAFLAHQRRKAERGGVPLLNPRVFASWPLRAGLMTQTVFWCQQAASYLVLGLYLPGARRPLSRPARSRPRHQLLPAPTLVCEAGRAQRAGHGDACGHASHLRPPPGRGRQRSPARRP
jgi:MFS family permease